MTDKLEALRTILTELQTTLLRRLDEVGAPDTPHVLMAVGPDGMAIIRANVESDELKAMSEDLGAAADAAMQERPDALN